MAYGIPVALFQAVGEVYLAYHGREHVAAFQVEVVVGTVKVGGHHGNVVRTVLKIEAFAHFQSGYFGDGIGLVRVFQRRSEECVFFHRLFGITGIDAGAAKKEKFFHSVAEAFADDVLLYLQVLVDEIGTVDTVGHNATHKGGGKEYIFGLLLVEEAAYGNSVEQIEFCVGLADEIGVSFLLKIFPDGRTYQSPVACYIYFGIFV